MGSSQKKSNERERERNRPWEESHAEKVRGTGLTTILRGRGRGGQKKEGGVKRGGKGGTEPHAARAIRGKEIKISRRGGNAPGRVSKTPSSGYIRGALGGKRERTKNMNQSGQLLQLMGVGERETLSEGRKQTIRNTKKLKRCGQRV